MPKILQELFKKKKTTEADQMGLHLRHKPNLEVLPPECDSFKTHSSILREIHEQVLHRPITIRQFEIYNKKTKTYKLEYTYMEDPNTESPLKTAQIREKLKPSEEEFIEKNEKEFQTTNFFQIPTQGDQDTLEAKLFATFIYCKKDQDSGDNSKREYYIINLLSDSLKEQQTEEE